MANMYGASLESIQPQVVQLKFTCDKQCNRREPAFCNCSHFKNKPFSLSRLLVKLQELNYNLKVKVLFDKYVAFFSSLCMLMASSSHVHKSKRQSCFKCELARSRLVLCGSRYILPFSHPCPWSKSLPAIGEMSQSIEGLSTYFKGKERNVTGSPR